MSSSSSSSSSSPPPPPLKSARATRVMMNDVDGKNELEKTKRKEDT